MPNSSLSPRLLVLLLSIGCSGEEASGNEASALAPGAGGSGPETSSASSTPAAASPSSPSADAATASTNPEPSADGVPTDEPFPTASVDPPSATAGPTTGASGSTAGVGGSVPIGGAPDLGMAGTGAAAGAPGGGMGGSSGGGGVGGNASVGGCNNPDFILCEDFESTDEGSIPSGWNAEGQVSVSSAQANSGARSLAMAAADNGPRRITHDAAGFGNAHWGRVYYRVQTPVPDPFVHSTIVAMQGEGPTVGSSEYRVVDTVKNEGGDHQFLYNVQPSSAGEFGKGSDYDWQFDGEWHCAEWHVDGANQSYHFYFDGDEVTPIAIDNGPGNYGDGPDRTDLPEQFDDIRVGWNNYQAAPPGFVAWIDDIAISTERIGCE